MKTAVVGAGIIGLSTAYCLLKEGVEVVVLDQAPEEWENCSFGNGGMIVPSHFEPLAAPGMVQYGLKMLGSRKSPFGVHFAPDMDLARWGLLFMKHCTEEHVEACSPILAAMHLQSRAMYLDWVKELDSDVFFATKGLMMICKDQETFDAEAKLAERAVEYGIKTEVITEQQINERDPGIRTKAAGAVHFLDDCHLAPDILVRSLRRKILELGGEIRYGFEVTGWESSGGRVTGLKSATATVKADEFVLATGAWTGELGRIFSLNMPMRSGKGYNVTLSNPRECPEICSVLVEGRIAVTPFGGRLRFSGTMEICGVDHSINENRVQGIVENIPKYFPAFEPSDFEDQPVWAGLRPVSADGMPYLGRSNRWHNLTVAAGHGMMGLSLGPVTGQLVTDVIKGRTPQIPIELMNPDRFR